MPWALATALAAAAMYNSRLRQVVMHSVMSMPFPLIDWFHATAVAYEFQNDADSSQGVLQRLAAVLITSLGGTTMMAFLLGQPCGWLCDNETIVPYIVMTCLFSYLPGGVLYRAVAASPTLRGVMGLLDDISWVSAPQALALALTLTEP